MSTNTWSAPRLIELPHQYYQIFQSYSQRTCVTCGEVPNDPAICLVCANYTCFRQNCCTQQGVSECVHVSHLSTGCHWKSLLANFVYSHFFKLVCKDLIWQHLIFIKSLDLVVRYEMNVLYIQILWWRKLVPMDLETWNLILQHSIQCGAGTSMYLLINSTIVVVIRGPRATLWGSVYLDDHGEEDRDLKWVNLDLWPLFES